MNAVLLLCLPVLYSCQYSADSGNSASSDVLAAFALKAINAGSGEFAAIDREFDSFHDLDKLEILDMIYVHKTVDEDSRFSQGRGANHTLILALREESRRLFGNKFIGDLTDRELSLVYSRVSPTLEENADSFLYRPSCQYHVYNQSVVMNNTIAFSGSQPVSFRRAVDTPDEYPCDYEVTFGFEPGWIGTDFWPTYRLLQSFGGRVISDQNRVLLGALRTHIWYNTSSESTVQRYFAKTLRAVR